MTAASMPRVRVPTSAKRGEVIEIRTLITHAMESGFRKDDAGRLVPRKILSKFTASFNGAVIFEADWHPAVAANPQQSFYFKARESGEFQFTWTDDDGSVYGTKAKLAVT
ncbi:thiosulfate oxidation carrier complex protein SoxZ [Ferrovibrio sp.]|uniref:thiosulfate oxidation carrier complex protein SoxZ n=1 Tax=Ferrovibrio sp. TaxID=1917215 RepID=UPI0025C27591|nr:thiosulfate oxidation carrier complex protein SoxZ [Ferrovibrio sp.]MBX3454521.1 thiosulfate oxidation carrier complex protein SoxZ [Ferrovibrio sp.]